MISKFNLNYYYLFLFFFSTNLNAQIIEGMVFNELNKEPLPFANIIIEHTDFGTITDSLGKYKLEGIKPGLYNLIISYTGFKKHIKHQIELQSNRTYYYDIAMKLESEQLKAVQVSTPAFKKTAETPLSITSFNESEIRRFPGAVMDITKIIKTCPGVAPKTTFGYNIIFRGGASHENRFFLDGIEIPSINHFTVQGASGGPVSLINTDFIQSLDVYTGGFPAEKSNVLSGILDLKQRDARHDRLGMRFTLGATEAALTLETPTGKNGNMILSGRKSFSEYLFKSIGLPVLPNYSDIQYRHKYRWGKHELTLIGLGALDYSRLNITEDPSESLLYNTGFIPEGDQNMFVGGINYKHYLDSGYYHFILSTNVFDNKANKLSVFDNNPLLDYHANEWEVKSRFEQVFYYKTIKLKYGINAEYDRYNVKHWSIVASMNNIDTISYSGILSFIRYGGFFSASKRLLNENLLLSIGLRSDASTYNSKTNNPLSQVSPRVGLSYSLNTRLSLNANHGIYYQLPPYTLLGFMENNSFYNQSTLEYIKCEQTAIGIEYTNHKDFKFSTEAFHKAYSDYPFLMADSISFANAVADYVALGHQKAEATGIGRAYGVEFLIQQKLKKNFFWMSSYTLLVSEFKDKYGKWAPSSWDNKQFINILFGKTFKKNWQLGLKWRYSGGTPYSPYDITASSNINTWQITNRGIFNYDSLNTQRLPAFHQMDIRLDKHYFFKKCNLNIYMDIQNLYRSPIAFLPYLTVERNELMQPIVNPENPNEYLVKVINSDTGRMLPTIGFILEF